MALPRGLAGLGAVAHAYAPVYAVGTPSPPRTRRCSCTRGTSPSVSSTRSSGKSRQQQWQRHFVTAYGSAADAIGFTGLHIDTYGYPRIAQDMDGNAIDMRSA